MEGFQQQDHIMFFWCWSSSTVLFIKKKASRTDQCITKVKLKQEQLVDWTVILYGGGLYNRKQTEIGNR